MNSLSSYSPCDSLSFDIDVKQKACCFTPIYISDIWLWLNIPSFFVFQGDIRIHMIYKSAGQEGFIDGKMFTKAMWRILIYDWCLLEWTT